MRIGFLTNEYPPLPSGGIGTSVRNLARALVADGHQVTVVGWGPEARFEDGGVRVRFLGETRLPSLGWLLNRGRARAKLLRLLEKEGLDVVEAPDWCGPSAGLRLPCPIGVRCHGSATYFADLLGERVRPGILLAERMALEGADGFASVSRFTAEHTRKLFGLPDRFQVIPNGVDLSRFRPGLPEEVEPGTVLYLGTLIRKKGVLDLGPAFSRIVKREPGARLALAGRDSRDNRTGSPSTWRLLEESLSTPARARTDLLGQVPYEQVQERIRRAVVCVFPSYAEAQPLAWLEAMACAKPLVGYDQGWAREVIRPGVDGILVPEGDTEALAEAVLGLLADPERAAALGASARSRVEAEFDSALAARRSLEWYTRLTQGR